MNDTLTTKIPDTLRVTLQQAAEALGCKQETLRRLCEARLIPATDIGKHNERSYWRIAVGDFDVVRTALEADNARRHVNAGFKLRDELTKLQTRIDALEFAFIEAGYDLTLTHTTTSEA